MMHKNNSLLITIYMNNNNLFIINVVSYDIKNDTLLITIYMNDDYSLLIRLVMMHIK